MRASGVRRGCDRAALLGALSEVQVRPLMAQQPRCARRDDEATGGSRRIEPAQSMWQSSFGLPAERRPGDLDVGDGNAGQQLSRLASARVPGPGKSSDTRRRVSARGRPG